MSIPLAAAPLTPTVPPGSASSEQQIAQLPYHARMAAFHNAVNEKWGESVEIAHVFWGRLQHAQAAIRDRETEIVSLVDMNLDGSISA